MTYVANKVRSYIRWQGTGTKKIVLKAVLETIWMKQ